MKKSYVGILICLLCLMVLSGCCSHQWVEATCDAPKTCASCAETEGEALGHNWREASCASPKHCETCGLTEGTALEHSWQEASCETPKTCTLCGSTEEEIPGHSFTPWTFDEENMHRTCETCALEESQAIDREIFLRQQLEGYWACPESTYGDKVPHFSYTEEGFFLFDGIKNTACQLRFSEYDENRDYYNAVLINKEGEELLLRYIPGDTHPVIVTRQDNRQIAFQKNEFMDLIAGRTWAGYCDGSLYLLNINWDGTVSGTIGTPTEQSHGDSVSGTWYAGTYEEYYMFLPFSFSLPDRKLTMLNPGINMDRIYKDTLSEDLRQPYIMLDGNGSIFILDIVAEEAVDKWVTAARELDTKLLGTWDSVQIFVENVPQPNQDYTITFLEDGTVIANLEQEYQGTWRSMYLELTDGPACAPTMGYEINLPPYTSLDIYRDYLVLYSRETKSHINFLQQESPVVGLVRE